MQNLNKNIQCCSLMVGWESDHRFEFSPHRKFHSNRIHEQRWRTTEIQYSISDCMLASSCYGPLEYRIIILIVARRLLRNYWVSIATATCGSSPGASSSSPRDSGAAATLAPASPPDPPGVRFSMALTYSEFSLSSKMWNFSFLPTTAIEMFWKCEKREYSY